MDQLHVGALPFYRMTPFRSKPGQLLQTASSNQLDNDAQ